MPRSSYFKNPYLRLVLLAVFVIYGLIMIKLLFLRGASYQWKVYDYNLVPFRTIKRYIMHKDRFNFDTWFKNLFGNIVLFIPLGVFPPLLREKFFRFKPFILLVVSILLAVELVQLFTRVGSFDVDDLILNLFGALIGFLLVKFCTKH
ncbi:hypothetical protein AWM70_06080 [Paenibacillus yonginensis]|uniref:VanZ-like domain-containing protein n=1 Tax=Paenibacillus yonginensis TaxID=1462996 RepID=A0A1B1MYE0_9BACL|nr:VanZ family protein [Paenibacillus yonginensis]ANS74202.1 hypothetical protein AWM70_06080 [Paenibacillus yonginensis]